MSSRPAPPVIVLPMPALIVSSPSPPRKVLSVGHRTGNGARATIDEGRRQGIDGVVAIAAQQGVGAGPVQQEIGARPALQPVVARIARQIVGTITAQQGIVAGKAQQRVAVRATRQPVIRNCPGQPSHGGVQEYRHRQAGPGALKCHEGAGPAGQAPLPARRPAAALLRIVAAAAGSHRLRLPILLRPAGLARPAARRRLLQAAPGQVAAPGPRSSASSRLISSRSRAASSNSRSAAAARMRFSSSAIEAAGPCRRTAPLASPSTASTVT